MADEQQLLDLIAEGRQGILAAVTSEGYPHLTNIYYVWDEQERVARVSTTADRVKSRLLKRDPRAALHVSGAHFFAYAVAECDAEISQVAAEPGDAACRELLAGALRLLRPAPRGGVLPGDDRRRAGSSCGCASGGSTAWSSDPPPGPERTADRERR